MAPELWNTQRSEEWLSSGKISSRDAFGSSRIELDGPSYWLFFDRAGLGILTATANPSSQPLYHQSKYLIFLLFAAERLNVQPNDPRTAKSLANEIEAMAEGFEVVKITRNMAENMATILREPEAGLGKNSPQMRSKKNER